MLRKALLITLLSLATPAAARDVVLSLGYGQFTSDQGRDVAMLGLETQGDRKGRFLGASWSLGIAAEFDSDGEFWIGLGPAGEWDLGRGWFAEASVMPGYYDGQASGGNLGSDLEIRSLVGIGRHIGARAAISLAVSHKSNANIGDTNPGQNSIALRTRWSF